jgi:ribosome maturation factor RimP
VARPDTRAVVSADVERAVTTQLPDVEIVDVQLAPGGLLRVLIDHPKGVDHELCSQVTNILRPYLDRYTLEVSSPGIPRPLVKPAHYVRHIGHAIQVRTAEPLDGRRTFTGVLRDANDERIALAVEDRPEEVVIPLGLVRKSHLVEEQR